MKKVFIVILIFSAINLPAQYKYDSLITIAGLYHLQRNPSRAIPIYEAAFRLRQPDALTAYKAAGVYALDSNYNKAWIYLHAAVDSGWVEEGWLNQDDYFTQLKKSAPAKWSELSIEVVAKERAYTQKLQLPALRTRINSMTIRDQQLRYERVQATTKEKRKTINAEIAKADADNLAVARDILAEYGWPTISQIGRDGQNNLWLIVQHADMDVSFQRRALQLMKRLLGSSELNAEHYAFLYDRVQCNLNYKQLYGTQVNWTSNGEASGFRAILEEDKVNERRKKLGLLPLHIYALTYGFTYSLSNKVEVHKRESLEQAWLKTGRDSAAYHYRQQNFDRVYDIYNDASAVQGGMSSEGNFKAAVLFARIAAINRQEKYSSIALDFLYLNFLRDELNRERWLKEKSFSILHKEERWKFMLKSP